MIPLRLSLKNFMSYRGPVALDFGLFDLAVLTGPNGAGKSTLLEAITWALWNQSRARSADDLVAQGETSSWVEFVFEMEGSIFRVLRRRDKKGKTASSVLELQTQVNQKKEPSELKRWESLTEGTLEQTQLKIEKLLRLSYQTFVNSSYLRQGHADEFTIKRPVERKAVLSDILGLSIYQKLEEKAKEKRKILVEKVLPLEMEEKRIKEELTQKEEAKKAQKELAKNVLDVGLLLKKMEEEALKWQEKRKEKELLEQKIGLERQRFLQIAGELKELLAEKREIAQTKEILGKILADKEKIIEKYAAFQRIKKKLEEETNKLLSLSFLKQKLAGFLVIEERMVSDVNKIAAKGTCPTCHRALTHQTADALVRELKKHFEEEYGEHIKELKTKITALNFQEEKYQELKVQIEEQREIEKIQQKLVLAEKELEGQQKRLLTITKATTVLLEEKNKIEQSGKELKAKLEKIGVFSLVEEKAKELAEKRKIQEEKLAELGKLTERLNYFQKLEERARELTKELKETLEGLALLEQLVLAFSQNGVPALIIEKTLPVLEEETNFLLEKISTGRFKVAFQTKRARKSGEGEIETLDIVISDEKGERPYEMFSGGEAFRINFAIRVALSKLLAGRAGVKLKFLVVDEGFGSLDSAGQEDIIAAINAIKEDFAKTLVITHIPEFKDVFQVQILVSKDEEGSHLEVVG
ncbi:SMC family ATPase [Candidatus Berkelbacteria bacterium]|nr:SMC family ATPase [Candidatus Berkelbacteria bacterium]